MASTYIKIPNVAFDLIDDGTTSTGKTWSSSKIQLELNALGEVYVRSTRFETISSGTSGSLTLTGSQQIVLDDFGGTTDAIITTIEGGRPTNQPASDASGNLIAATLDGTGNWTLVGTPESYPVALVYRTREYFNEYDDTDSSVMGGLDLYFDNRVLEDSVTASSSKIIEVQALSQFTKVEYNITVSGNGQVRNFKSVVSNNSSVLTDQLFARSTGLDFSYNVNVNGSNMEIQIINNETFDLDVRYTRSIL